MARIDELRLMTRVARLYYEPGMRQPEIAAAPPLAAQGLAPAPPAGGGDRACHRACPAGTYPDLELTLERSATDCRR